MDLFTGHRPVIWTALVTVFAVLLTSVFVLRRYASHAAGPAQRPRIQHEKIQEPRDLTIRIDEIPATTAQPELENHLLSIIERRRVQGRIAHISVRSLVSRDRFSASATVVVCSTLDGKDVCQLLSQAASSKYPYCFNYTFDGITPIYAGDPCVDADIIAVTGLAGHALGSWKAKGDDYKVWLRDFLGHDIPNIRILLYGYDTALQNSKTKQSIEDLGRTLLEQVVAFRARSNTTHRPVIFIGHSLGGLVIKQALIHAHREKGRDEEYLDFSKACFGMVFLGVPNSGLRHAELQEFVKGQPNEELIHELVTDGDEEARSYIRSLKSQFGECGKGLYRVACFYERKPTRTVGINEKGELARTGTERLQVLADSACDTGLEGQPPGIPLNTDHSGLVKYNSRSYGDYPIVCEKIRKLVEQASAEVPARFNLVPLPPLKEEVGECLRSLAFGDMQTRHDTIEYATWGTCGWLFEHELFHQWLQADRGILWVQGKPGSGKSTLMKFAAKEYPLRYPIGPVVTFFCHGRGHGLQKTPLGLVRSVLHQLLKLFPGSFSPMIDQFVENQRTIGRVGKEWQWQQQQLQDFLMDGLTNVLDQTAVTFLFDALDELGEEPAVKLVDFLSQMTTDIPETTHKLRICFSCRHYPILKVNDNTQEIRVERENHDDIARFVKSRFTRPSFDNIVTLLIERGQGVFMWVRLVSERILQRRRKGVSLAKIEGEIQTIPQGLEDLYFDILQTNLTQDDDTRAEALALFQLVCFSLEPLLLEEIPWALTMMLGPEKESLEECGQAIDFIPYEDAEVRVTELSCGLVETVPVGEDDSIIQFVHQSAKEYLMSNGLEYLEPPEKTASSTSDSEHQRSTAEEGHWRFFMACSSFLRILQRPHPRDDEYYCSWQPRSKETFPLERYAATHWDSHLRLGNPNRYHLNTLIKTCEQALAFESSPRLRLRRRTDHLRRRIDHRRYPSSNIGPGRGEGVRSTLVHLLASIDSELLSHLLNLGDTYMAQINAQCDYGHTPLIIAASRGFSKAVDILIGTGKADFHLRNKQAASCLSVAVRFDHPAIVQRLLDTEEFDVNLPDYLGDPPLVHAVNSRSRAVVQLLLNAEEININYWTTALTHAARHQRSVDILQMLLSRGEVDINLRDPDGYTPLTSAIIWGSQAAVQLLLSRGEVDVNLPDRRDYTPLTHSVRQNDIISLQQLLRTGEVDVNIQDRNGFTALHWAVKGPHWTFGSYFGDIVQQLLNTGEVNVNLKDKFRRTPLHYAARYGHTVIAQNLLDTDGVEVNTRQQNGRTPLFYAVLQGHAHIVRMLLHTDKVDVDAADRYGQSPLGRAADWGYADIVRMLLDTGRAHPGFRDFDGETPLYNARTAYKLMLKDNQKNKEHQTKKEDQDDKKNDLIEEDNPAEEDDVISGTSLTENDDRSEKDEQTSLPDFQSIIKFLLEAKIRRPGRKLSYPARHYNSTIRRHYRVTFFPSRHCRAEALSRYRKKFFPPRRPVGYDSSEEEESGDGSSGDGLSGDGSSGDGSSGDGSSGDWSSGDGSSGDWSLENESSDDSNSDIPKFPLRRRPLKGETPSHYQRRCFVSGKIRVKIPSPPS